MIKLFATGIAITIGLAALVWLWVGYPSLTEAQSVCESEDPVQDYDVQIVTRGKDLPEIKVASRVSGRKSHTTTEQDGVVSLEVIYDGSNLVFMRYGGAERFDKQEVEDASNFDVGAQDFPMGGASLCPDVEALGAEYIETDTIGKKYQFKGVEEKDTHALWIDDDGWLIQVESYHGLLSEGFSMLTTISGRGEENRITTPAPPYLEN